MTTWHPTTPAWYTQTAERVCTPKQLEVLKHASHELTDSQIGARLGITRQAVQQRRNAGTQAIALSRDNYWPPTIRRIIEGAA